MGGFGVRGSGALNAGVLRIAGLAWLVAVAACGVERFDSASCACVGEHPRPRSTLEEMQLSQCVLTSRGDGPREFDETQCRLWLASPWLKEPPSDDVAGRVLEFTFHYQGGGGNRPPKLPPLDGRIPWAQDNPCIIGPFAVISGPLPEATLREQALAAACPDMADTACRHRYLTEAVQLLRPHVEFELFGEKALPLPLYCGIRSDGSLDLASIGHHWWRMPAAKPGSVPPAFAAEVPRVDLGALLAEIQWMRQVHPDISVRLAAEDDVTWGDYWAVWWAIDEAVTTDRSDRHWSRVHEPVLAAQASDTAMDDDTHPTIADSPIYTCSQWRSRHRVVNSDFNLWRGIGWPP
jgi:hypothetical protein